MITAMSAPDKKGNRFIAIGLTNFDLSALLMGKPIKIDSADSYCEYDLFIFADESNDDIVRKLKEAGLLDENTVIHQGTRKKEKE